MATKSTTKPLTKLQEMNLRALKLKEESISTILTTIKNNQSFAKLLIFTLNSLETFVSPPNREIKINSSIIIRLEGVELLHIISVKNLKNDEIVELAGDILYKLISVNNRIDKELTKLFAEKNGHKAVIDIVLKKNKQDKCILPYIKIINGLVQIPQLVPTLIENNIIEALNLTADKNKQEGDNAFIKLNLNILKQISTQKTGRDYLINNNYIEKIINNVNTCADKKEVKPVLCGLGIIGNLCRNEEGKKAVKNSNCIDCLSHVLTQLGHEQSILKMCAKIYCKIASVDDLKAQLELLKKYYEENKNSGKYDNNFVEINKSLELVSNFMLVDEIGMQLQEEDNFELLKNLFMQIQKIDLSKKDKDFLNLFVSLNKNFMVIFFRLFNLDSSILEKSKELIKSILSSIVKNWESVKNKNDKAILKTFDSYFVSYGEILNQHYNLMKSKKDNNTEKPEFVNDLIYINKNILINGQKILDVDQKDSNPHCVACRLVKICDDLSLKENPEIKIENKNDIISSLIDCYSYFEFLFINKDDEEILCNSLEVIFDLVNAHKDFRQNKLGQIIFKICDFMNKKNHQRFPCLQCMKLLDMFLTPEYVTEYIKSKDPVKNPTHAINYTECIVNVMTYRESPDLQGKVRKVSPEQSAKVEGEINNLGGALLERLIDELDFRKLIKRFCNYAETFEPSKNNKESINKLESSIKVMHGIMNVKNYFDLGANIILNSLKNLLEKEIKYIEFFKRDKSNEKNPEFNNILENTSSRMFLELFLNLKINEISQQKMNYEIYTKNLDIIFLFLTKSLDKKNIMFLLNHLKNNYSFILDNENNIKLQNNENVSEKMTSVDVALLRKMIEEDDIISPIIENLTILAENNILLCNNMVKAGCPRLLLQIIETSPNESNVESALYLLKIISFSNKDNLQMVASQNAMNVFFQAKNKYSSNDKIIDHCVEITKEILKLPGQEKYASDLITETINDFNQNAQKDLTQNEIRQKLLNSLQIINSFVTNKSQSDLINSNEEFIENFKKVTENTFKDNELDSVNEKLVENELSLLKKIKDNKIFEYDYTIDKLIDIIKNKSKYQDILISAADEFLKNIMKQDSYEKYIAKKVDNSFVDCIFDDIDNYLGNIKVTKELNNILCYLCLYNEDLANYIKQKGGLANILEELKINIDSNDNNSQFMKLNSLKMLNSLCKDKDGIESLIKSGGTELLNKIIENEIELYKEYKNNFENDLYKTRELINLSDNIGNKENNDKKNESYMIYSIKLLQNIIDVDEKHLNNDKIINNLVFISEVNYPDKELFRELTKIFNKNVKYLPSEEKYLFLLLKNAFSLECKYLNDKNFVENVINTNVNAILPKVLESNNYLNNLKDSLNKNKINPLQLSYLYECVTNSEKNNQNITAIIEAIEEFTLDYFNYYREKSINKVQEEIPDGVIIYLQELILYILKNKKDKIPQLNDIISTFIFFGQQYLYKTGHDLFSLFYLQKSDSIFENSDDQNKNNCYRAYVDDVAPKSLEYLSYINQIISSKNDYNSLDDIFKTLFDLIIKNLKNFYSDNNANTELIRFDIIFNLITDLINVFNNIENIENEKRNKIISDLYDIIMGILSQSKISKDELNANNKLLLKLLSDMKASKEKNYTDDKNIFPKIINQLLHNSDSSPEISEKTLDFILEDLKCTPPRELNANLDSLALYSKDLALMKNLINNDELISHLLKIYNDKENLTLPQRRNISNIFYNLLKNTYNVENIIEKKPEIIKAVMDKVVQKDNVIKDEQNIDIPQKELNIITSIFKDKHNANQLIEKQLIVPENVESIIDNYKGVHESLNDLLSELQNIMDILTNKKDKEENLKNDKALLDNLKEKIIKAFNGHLDELKKVNTEEFNTNNNEVQDNLQSKNIPQDNNILESTSNMKKRRLSVISRHLFYSPYNSQINSPISTKSNEEMSSILDNLLSLLRLLYSNDKDCKDKDIQAQSISLIKDALETLKMFTICPDNHKSVEELGLLNFMEKLNKKEDDFAIYLSALDVVKNCTWSENAVLSLIENQLFDKLIDEVLEYYNNPQLLSENEDNKTCFFYDNIVLSNICKVNKGFEAIYNKIGIEKLLSICKNTGNLDFLTSCVMVLNHYFENPKLKDELNKINLINDIIEICKKGFNSNVNDINENLFIKTMKLIGNIYDDKSKEFIGNMDIVQIINLTFDKYKDEPEYFYNVIFILKIVSLNHKNYSDEIVDLKLINRIAEYIILMDQKDDLITNYSALMNNLMINNEDNRSKMCSELIINNLLFFINKYSPKLDNSMNKPEPPQSVRATLLTLNNKIVFNENTSIISQDNDSLFEIYNLILNNFLNALQYISSNEKSKEFISDNKYNDSLLNTINKPKINTDNIILCLLCLGNYYTVIDNKEWKNDFIEKTYVLLQTLQKDYYTCCDILLNINIFIGKLLKGLSLKFLIERFYSLALDGLNCQDWNEILAKLTLDILKQCLIQHEELRNEVFESTVRTILNILNLFQNNLIIIINGYEILVLFTKSDNYAYGLASTDIFSDIRNTLSNKDFNNDPENRLKVRLAIYKLLNFLAYDKTTNAKISLELMESFIKEFMNENFSEDLNEMTYLLVTLFKTKLPIEPFIQNAGLNALSLSMQNFYDKKKFILNCIYMIREICFSSVENKDKLLDINIKEKIQNVLDKTKPEDKKIRLEGKTLLYNLNYEKTKRPKTSFLPPLGLIEKEKIIKQVIYNFMVKGINIKAANPRGKIKEFVLAFSPDLMKLYLKKPKREIIPPKAKYTIETPLVNEILKDYEMTNFKKSGLFNKPPEKQLCFAIEQTLLKGQKSPKKLVIICSHPMEAYQIWGCVEIIVDYVKTKCHKPNTCKVDDMNGFFLQLMINQPKERTADYRKRTVMLRGNM